jgi:hypothetical protein
LPEGPKEGSQEDEEDGKMKKITNYNVQNYMTNGIHASMQSCIHAFMPYHSQSPLFPSFLSSQLPSFPLYPLAAGGKKGD